MVKRRDKEVENFVAEHHAWLTEWHDPEETIAYIEVVDSALSRDFAGRLDFLNDNETLPFREMWVLARCAQILGRSHVRLSSFTVARPDGYSRRDGLEFGAELTEAMEPGRKRRFEDWKPGEWREDPGSEWVRRADLIPIALESSLTKKKAIEYPSGTELFIYLNIGEYGIRQRETEDEIRRQLGAPLGPFYHIFVLWKDKLFRAAVNAGHATSSR